MRTGVVDDLVAKHIPHDAYPEAWDIAGLKQEVVGKLNLDLPVDAWAKEEGIAEEEVAPVSTRRPKKPTSNAFSAIHPKPCVMSRSR